MAAAARFLSTVIEKCPELLTADHWDAAIVCTASWMLTLKYSSRLLLSPLTQCPLQGSKCAIGTSASCPLGLENHSGAVFAVAVLQLYKSLSAFLSTPRSESDPADVRKFHEKLSLEWTDVFADDIHDVLISVFSAISGKLSNLLNFYAFVLKIGIQIEIRGHSLIM